MKNFLFLIISFFFIIMSCSKKEPGNLYPQDTPKTSYDTVPKDSFSAGATSVDIIRQIRMSSQKYRDSVKEALKTQQQEEKLKAELEKENKKVQDEEKKKTEKEKKQQKTETPATAETTKQ
ncbi:hypothetical protein ODZ84_13775 [Chryseobacterium fluminis]|uniref:hypothetical protein n=1 Tax=Chryseobacterium fluminis TaxID=2983606 RepID=UPI002252FF22|nr:hypothetical protein [Chryseobacterium sp. MMS21-Ot14]UZT96294.1 hypothetical protein ODZ84_13775 [Chryseobacterium sp. MMS21-Ot14]